MLEPAWVGEMLCVPLVCWLPVHAPVAVQLVAPVLDQVRVTLEPARTLVLLRDRFTVGAGVGLDEPPSPPPPPQPDRARTVQQHSSKLERRNMVILPRTLLVTAWVVIRAVRSVISAALCAWRVP